MKRVAVVLPTTWDREQLPRTRAVREGRVEIVLTEPPDEDCPWDLDVDAYLRQVLRRDGAGLSGVVTTSDYPGAVLAAMAASSAGLPGPPPAAVLRCGHKHLSRVLQREWVPDAVPRFELIEPGKAPSLGLPCFVKPVKGSYSLFARRVDDAEDLETWLRQPAIAEFRGFYVRLFDELMARHGLEGASGGSFLAEELVSGAQATVEGFVHDGGTEILGIVDSVLDEGGSFARFDYPSRLPEGVQERMASVARRLVRGAGLTSTLFNVEMAWDEGSDLLRVIEINPRPCGQFADLYEKVDGTSAADVALEIATSGRPQSLRRRGRFAAASSVPLRVFQPVRVVAAPSGERVAEVEQQEPGTLVWVECATGQELTDFAFEDGRSFRYAVINVGAASHDEIAEKAARVTEALGFDLAPLPPAARGA